MAKSSTAGGSVYSHDRQNRLRLLPIGCDYAGRKIETPRVSALCSLVAFNNVAD